MENKILADTSILVELQRNNKNVIELFSSQLNNLTISRITANEIIHGSRNKKELNLNISFLDDLEIVELNEEISFLSYKLIEKYGLKVKFGIADALIAATIISTKQKLWTLNEKHFRNIREVKLFNAK